MILEKKVAFACKISCSRVHVYTTFFLSLKVFLNLFYQVQTNTQNNNSAHLFIKNEHVLLPLLTYDIMNINKL